MKNQTLIAIACATLLASCAGQPSEQDYIDAFTQYAGNNIVNKESITIAHTRFITLADSIDYTTASVGEE